MSEAGATLGRVTSVRSRAVPQASRASGDHHVRERIEDLERTTLSPRATRSNETRGRERLEEPHPLRTAFQRDRDRIIHSKAFRRLKHKTQVFIAPEGDHYRVRLTHTLEVSQIARTIARALGLNEDLTEAIALGHDLGHTPFGHLGEEALSPFLATPFRHNEQSLRVVDHLENDGNGLNLTVEVRNGIVNHTWSMPAPFTMEGQVARLADRVAYVNHDIDDAIRAEILSEDALPDDVRATLGPTHSARINTLVSDAVAESEDADEVRLSQPVADALESLREFMFERVYLRPEANEEQRKAISLVRSLFSHYLDHPDEIPGEYAAAPGDTATRIADYIAGMTDRYALRMYEQLFLPQGWLL